MMAAGGASSSNADFEHLFKFGASLGHGAFGSVHKVFKLADGKIYALKILNIDKRNPAYDDFMKEAWIMMSLVHPNILRIFDTHESTPEHGGPVRAAIQLELCQGGDLHKYIIGRICKKISPRKMTQWMMQLSSALAYIHEKFIIHRDIKPQNIFLDRKGNLKIGDFGVSKELLATITRTCIGTPAFMSPETQYGKYGMEADIYSLGCVFICMATLNIIPLKESGGFHDLPPPSLYGRTINSLIMQCVGLKEERPKARNILLTLTNMTRTSGLDDKETMVPETPEREPDSLSFHIFSSEPKVTDYSQTSNQSPVKMRNRKGRSTVRFHRVVGKSINLKEGGRLACKDSCTELYAVVFTHKPVSANQIISIEISETHSEMLSLVSFGFTSADPEEMDGLVPESVPKLKESAECWTAVRYESFQRGSVFSLHYDLEGNIFSTCKGKDKYRQENQVLKPDVPVWAVFGFTFPVIAVRISDEFGSGVVKIESVAGFPGKPISRPYSGLLAEDMTKTTFQEVPFNQPPSKPVNQKEELEELESIPVYKLCIEDEVRTLVSDEVYSNTKGYSTDKSKVVTQSSTSESRFAPTLNPIWSGGPSHVTTDNEHASNLEDFEILHPEDADGSSYLATANYERQESHLTEIQEEPDSDEDGHHVSDSGYQSHLSQPQKNKQNVSHKGLSHLHRRHYHKDTPSLGGVDVGSIRSMFSGNN